MSQNRSTEDTASLNTSFADRLHFLIGDSSVSAFARKVALSESLIRKYLKGSEPSLTRADQIARQANVSLDWLASGFGRVEREPENIDLEALRVAQSIITELDQNLSNADQKLTLILSAYQSLLVNKSANGRFDEVLVRQYVFRLVEQGAYR